MNNPKVFLTALLFFSISLFLFTSLLPENQPTPIKATVISHTITQSLDGHRHYLNVELQSGEIVLISAPTGVDCPQGSLVTLFNEGGAFGIGSRYRFVSCIPRYK